MYLFPVIVLSFCAFAFLFLVYFLATVKTGEMNAGPRKAIRQDSNMQSIKNNYKPSSK